MQRRDLLCWLGLASTAVACRQASSRPSSPALTSDSLMVPPPGRATRIAMIAYPQMTALDLVGPQLFLASLLNVDLQIVARTLDPVPTDTGFSIVPTMSFADCPAEVDVLFIGGGSQGTVDAMRDSALLELLASRGASATWVTSVCTGSLVLGAAGLLRGYRATTHWVAREVLATVGAIAVDERVVIDRNRMTGAGVSAGLDLGLALAVALRGESFGRAVALNAEYAPTPPIVAGTPATAGPEPTKMLRDMYAPIIAAFHAAGRAAPAPSS